MDYKILFNIKNAPHFARFTNPFTSSGLFYHNSLDQSVSNSRGSGKFFIITMFNRKEIHVINANSADPECGI